MKIEKSKAECKTCGWVKMLPDEYDLEAYIRVHLCENEEHECKLTLEDGTEHRYTRNGLD
jgi:hypothetical protein